MTLSFFSTSRSFSFSALSFDLVLTALFDFSPFSFSFSGTGVALPLPPRNGGIAIAFFVTTGETDFFGATVAGGGTNWVDGTTPPN